jgi:DNA-binding MarR family transcriptional regulator
VLTDSRADADASAAGRDSSDPVAVAGRLRHSVFRMARLLRQQDDSGHAPALITALSVIDREGPLTLGALAAQEQVSPPTITRVVDALEARGFVERIRDAKDRRVWRVKATARGRRRLEASRTRRTEWLATQLRALPREDRERLAGALEVLEHLTAAPAAPARAAP